MSSFRIVPGRFEGHSRKDSFNPVILDFDARVPIPFSVFPSSYRSDAATETTRVRVEGEAHLPSGAPHVGREDTETRYSSFSASLPKGKDRTQYREEEVKVYEEDRDYRQRRSEDVTVYEEEDHYRQSRSPEVELSRERYVLIGWIYSRHSYAIYLYACPRKIFTHHPFFITP